MKQPDTFTSPIAPLITRYLAVKRALGRRAVSLAYTLRYVDRFLVSTTPSDFHAVQESLKGKKVQVVEAELAMVPKTTVQVSGKEGDSLLKLLETLEELDDVQKVWANFDMDVSEMARAEG